MYKIDIKSFPIDWSILCYGIENDLIATETAIDYTSVYLANNQDESNPDIIDLLVLEDLQKDKVLNLLKRICPTNLSDNSRKKILRYLILDTARNNLCEVKALLEFVEKVYADFDYPSDMNSFITYMPITDGYNSSLHTPEENLNRLLNNFDKFMINELSWIKNNHTSEDY